MNTKEIGSEAEQVAIDYLKGRGYQILERNYRMKKREIDIIVEKENLLIFVEVKMRSSTAFGFPEQTLKSKQKQNILKAAKYYIEKIDWQHDIRFDIIAILKNDSLTEIDHFEDAFS